MPRPVTFWAENFAVLRIKALRLESSERQDVVNVQFDLSAAALAHPTVDSTAALTGIASEFERGDAPLSILFAASDA